MIWWGLVLILAATMCVGFVGGAFAQQNHPCDTIWCKKGKFLGLQISGSTTLSGTLTATNFVGDGSGLTNLPGGGGGGSPSAPLTSVQFNSATAFGGTPNFVVASITPTVVSLTGTLSATNLYGRNGSLTTVTINNLTVGSCTGCTGALSWYSLTNIPAQVQQVSNSGYLAASGVGVTGVVTASTVSTSFSYATQASYTTLTVGGQTVTATPSWYSILNIPTAVQNISTGLIVSTTTHNGQYASFTNIAGGGAGLTNLPTFESVAASVASSQNDYVISGMTTAAQTETEFRVTPTSSLKFTGFSSTGIGNGKVLTVVNDTSINGSDGRVVIFERESASSTAVNRFSYGPMPIPLMLMPQQNIRFRYSTTNQRWNFLSGNRHGSPQAFLDEFDNGVNQNRPASFTNGTGASAFIDGSGFGSFPTSQRAMGVFGACKGTTATGRAVLGIAGTDMALGHGAFLAVSRPWPETLATGAQNYKVYTGLGDMSVAGAPSDAVAYAYDPSVSANWRIMTASAGSTTSTTTSLVVSTTQAPTFLVFVNGDGSQGDFIHGTSEVWTFDGSINTTMPNTTTGLLGVQSGIVGNTGTTDRCVDFDFMGWLGMVAIP